MRYKLQFPNIHDKIFSDLKHKVIEVTKERNPLTGEWDRSYDYCNEKGFYTTGRGENR